MDTKEIKSILLDKIASLAKKATSKDIYNLAYSYEIIRRTEKPDPMSDMAKTFATTLAIGRKGDKDDK